MARGFVYLAVVLDWATRRVLSWRLSITMEAAFCVETLDDALARHGKPEIFYTDQGSQFTGSAFTGVLAGNGVAISMDGKGAWRDNVLQRLRRAAMAQRQIRGGLSAILRNCRRGAKLDWSVSRLLQRTTTSFES
ncbi:hypothetical protein ACVIGB_008602 [Bradyrhizobium sp. USDA 4341]